MSETYDDEPQGRGANAVNEAEILIGRLVDGEAAESDRDRFEQLAAAEPGLWRSLALQQHDMSTLAEQVQTTTAAIDAIDLPRRWLFPSGLTWTLAFSGWAAVVIVAVWWGVIATTGAMKPTAIAPATAGLPPRLSAEEHYRRYLAAPYVLGDMEPVVLEVERLSDGRVAVHFIRRIEEVAFLDPNSELPVDDQGELTKDPSELRTREPVVVFPN